MSLLENFRVTVPEFNPEVVLLCVKPQVLLSSISGYDMLSQLLKSILHKCTTISLLAGIRSHELATAFNLPERNIVRLMLNTTAEICSTSVFYHTHPTADPITMQKLQTLFEMIGRPVIRLNDESLMDVATGVCGSGIAFFYEVIQAISDVSVKNGLTRAESLQVAAQLSKSAGEMLLTKQNSHPYQLRDQVSSPAGTTIFGLEEWHQQSTNQKIKQAVQVSIDRARELSKIYQAKLEDPSTDVLFSN